MFQALYQNLTFRMSFDFYNAMRKVLLLSLPLPLQPPKKETNKLVREWTSRRHEWLFQGECWSIICEEGKWVKQQNLDSEPPAWLSVAYLQTWFLNQKQSWHKISSEQEQSLGWFFIGCLFIGVLPDRCFVKDMKWWATQDYDLAWRAQKIGHTFELRIATRNL